MTRILSRVLVRYKLITIFVDAVVGEVGENVVHLGALVSVLVGSKPDEAVIIEVDTEGVHTGHQDVKSQVKLGLVDEVRPGNIP